MSHAYWYASRGTGIVSLVLLTLVVALGVAGSLRLRAERWPRFLVVGLHRNLTLLALAFLGVHIATSVLDSFAPIGLRDALVPFLASYRPIWLGLGAVAFDLLLALTLTSLLRARVGYRAWRALHWLAYGAWPVALAHGLGTGSDVRFGWMQALTVACVLLVLAAVARRLARAAAAPATRVAAGAAAALVAAGGFVWYRTGPGAPGWAARAGTPSALLATARAVVRAAAPAAPGAVVLRPPFTADLTGRLSTSVDRATGLVLVSIRARTGGAVPGRLWIRLRGEPAGDGGVSMSAGGAAFGPVTAPNEYVGTITALQGTDIGLSLHDASGRRLALAVQLSVDGTGGAVSGVVHAAAGEGDSE
jgi:DMSO/TMAO reductase YedYZ heme-binding membrane subunit